MSRTRRTVRFPKALSAAFALLLAVGASLGVPLAASAAPPAPVDDAFSVHAGVTLDVPVPGVLANDTDADPGDTLTAALALAASNGTVTVNPDGSFRYVPVPGFTGIDTFRYSVGDGTATSEATLVTIEVTNAPPIPADDVYSVHAGDLLFVPTPGVLANDTDADPGDTLTATLVLAPANGTATMNPDGSFSYTPVAGFAGVDSFRYYAGDGTTTSGATLVTVNVTNADPVAAGELYSTHTGVPIVVPAPGILDNDTDPDGDSMRVLLDGTTTFGSLSIEEDGSFVYTPDPGFIGSDLFSYRVSDGAGTSSTVTTSLFVAATGTNVAPVAVSNAYTTPGYPLAVAAPGLLANDLDADGDLLSVVLQSAPAHGTLDLGADGSFLYTPVSAFVGVDSFSYRVNDGTISSPPTTVSITVTPVRLNAPPVASDDAYATTAGAVLSPSAPGVLGNDIDDDGDPVTAALVTGPAHGALALNGDGSFTYTPDVGYTGNDVFTYSVDDGFAAGNTATVELTIMATSAPPSGAEPARNPATIANTGSESAGPTALFGGVLLGAGAMVLAAAARWRAWLRRAPVLRP